MERERERERKRERERERESCGSKQYLFKLSMVSVCDVVTCARKKDVSNVFFSAVPTNREIH
jgi:hypothetical protein